jgi:hypothetical protein
MGRGIAVLFLDLGTRRVWVVSTTPRPLYPPATTRYSLYRRLGGPQGRSGRVRKISPHQDSIPVQPVANRYTGWAILALASSVVINKTFYLTVGSRWKYVLLWQQRLRLLLSGFLPHIIGRINRGGCEALIILNAAKKICKNLKQITNWQEPTFVGNVRTELEQLMCKRGLVLSS